MAATPPVSSGPRRRALTGLRVLRRWLIAVVILAAVAVPAGVGVAVWRVHTRRQPTVTDALPAMDGAIADVLTAAGPGPAVTVAGVVRAAVCRLDPVREGGRYNRVASMYTARGEEDPLITRIAQGLPAGYRARREAPPPAQAAPLAADAGHGVHLSVREAGYGWVTATATTGCTPGSAATITGSPAAGDPGLGAVTRLLDALGTRAASVHRNAVACPAGQIVTVAAVSAPTDTERLADRLPPRPGAREFTFGADRVAYREGPTSLVVAVSDDGRAITVRHTTSSC